MERKLVTEILEYNKDKNQFLSNDQIEDLLYYLIKHYEVDEYVNNISFVEEYPDKKGNTNAEYDLVDKNITIFERNIKKHRNIMMQGEYTLEDKLYKKVFANEAVIQILIHELIHARQVKSLCESKDYDLEFEMLKCAYTDEFIENPLQLPYLKDYYGTTVESYFGSNYHIFKKQLDTYSKRYNDSFYKVDPSEINAEYESYKEIIYINEYLNPELNEDWKDILYLQTEAHYVPTPLRVVSPFEKFIKKRNSVITLDKFDINRLKAEPLPLDKRLSYGLPISKNEFDAIETHVKSLHS